MSDEPRPKLPVPPTVSEIRPVMAGLVRCRLCRLDAVDDGGAAQITIMYGGHTYGDEGNELVGLWKRWYLCRPCIRAIVEAANV